MIDEIVARALTRRLPSLASIVRVLATMMRRSSDLFTEKHRADLGVALEYLRQETELVPSSTTPAGMESFGLIPIPERPKLREDCARLVFWFNAYLAANGLPVPAIISSWLDNRESEVFPEVRRALAGE